MTPRSVLDILAQKEGTFKFVDLLAVEEKGVPGVVTCTLEEVDSL